MIRKTQHINCGYGEITLTPIYSFNQINLETNVPEEFHSPYYGDHHLSKVELSRAGCIDLINSVHYIAALSSRAEYVDNSDIFIIGEDIIEDHLTLVVYNDGTIVIMPYAFFDKKKTLDYILTNNLYRAIIYGTDLQYNHRSEYIKFMNTCIYELEEQVKKSIYRCIDKSCEIVDGLKEYL